MYPCETKPSASNQPIPTDLIVYCRTKIPRIRQKHICAVLGISPSMTSRIFSGQRKLTPENAHILHDRLQIPYEVLKMACHEL